MKKNLVLALAALALVACGNTTPTTAAPTTNQPTATPTTEAPKNWTIATELKNGDDVLIAAPAYKKLLSVEKVTATSYYNKGVDYTDTDFSKVTDKETFDVTVNADGSYTFTSLSGVSIALADSYSSLNDTGANKSWTLEAKEGSAGVFYVKNTVRGNYLEWYAEKDNWSTYATSSLSDLFEISFFVK
jgi:hypothetical protein